MTHIPPTCPVCTAPRPFVRVRRPVVKRAPATMTPLDATPTNVVPQFEWLCQHCLAWNDETGKGATR